MTMPMAVQLAAWVDKYGDWTSFSAGPRGPAGTVGGVPFCQDELGAGAYLRVRVAFGAALSNPSSSWTFTDVTNDVMQADGHYINISPIGRQAESIRVPTAGCAFRLNNQQNLYSKNNALSPNWPNVRSNTPVVVDVTLDGGANWGIMFWGEATSFQPTWDKTGNYAVVDVQAYGRIRRLEQHDDPLQSVILRNALSMDTIANVAGYWSCEDGTESTQLSSGLAGGSPLLLSTTGSSFASYTGFGGSAPLFVFGSGVNFQATLSSSVNTTGKIYFRTFLNTPIGLPDSTVMFSIFVSGASSGMDRWNIVYFTGGGIGVNGTRHDGTIVVNTGAIGFGVDNQHYYLSVELVQSGSDINWLVFVNKDNGGGSTTALILTGTFSSQTAGRATKIAGGGSGNMTGCAMGHVGISNNISWLFSSANLLTGYTGETPGARIARLCDEQGVEFEAVGFYDTTVAMGPQGVDTFMNLLRECEAADDGFLYDGLSAGLQYQGPSQRYNQNTALTLDAVANELLDLQPIDDDLSTINKMTVTQKNGSSETVEQTDGILGTGPDGIGTVSGEITVSNSDASRLLSRATWEVHKGTIEGFRYPLVPLNLRAHPSVAQQWMNRTDGFTGPIVPGSRADITNISSWATQHPAGTVPLMIEGWSMRLTNLMWEVDPVCTSNRRYDVFKLGDTQLGRVQTSGSTVAVDAATGSSTLSVASTNLWTTTAAKPGDFPMFLEVDGIRVLAHSVGQALNDNINFEAGIAHWTDWSGTGTWVLSAVTGFAYSGNGSMLLTPAGGSASGGAAADRVAVTVGTTYYLSGWWFCPNGWASCTMAIDWYTATSGGSFISSSIGPVTNVPAGVWTNVSATVVAPATAAGGALRFRLEGSPTATDIAYVDEGLLAVASATSPQTFSVDPSTVTKPLLTGKSVKVWHAGVVKF